MYPGGHRQPHGRRGGDFGAGFAADTIGSEKSHDNSLRKNLPILPKS